MNQQRMQLEQNLLSMEESESRKDREWEYKKQEIKDSIKNLCAEYMKLEDEMVFKIQELSPIS